MVVSRATIGSLPDDVLLEVFYAYRKLAQDDPFYRPWDECWPTLGHVCRRWRFVILASPQCLGLYILCTPTRPVRKLLDIWPPFPLVVNFNNYIAKPSEGHFDNLIAALERLDRVHQIAVSNLPGFVWERIITVTQGPFPALTSLKLAQPDGFSVDDLFLNGFTPNLQHLTLFGSSIPRRLRSALHLRSLRLYQIPNSGYISPETMATSLSALPQLESLTIRFKSPTSHPRRRNRPVPPPIRSVLPALVELHFTGLSEYLEVLTARIDAPLLEHFDVVFFNQLVFDIPQIIRCFGHQDKLFRPSSLTLHFYPNFAAYIDLSGPMRYPARYCMWNILCRRFDWQVFSIAQICSQIPSLRSSVESLNITSIARWDSSQEDEVDPTTWHQLFHSFPSVQSLEISEPLIALVLPPLTGQPIANVLPSLHTLSVLRGTDMSDETAQQVIKSFIASRQQCDRPVTVSESRRREFP